MLYHPRLVTRGALPFPENPSVLPRTPRLRRALAHSVIVAALASAPSAHAFDGSRAAAIVQEIASDDFAGRKSGLASGVKVEDYVAKRFAEWNVAPAGSAGTYFVEFSQLSTEERGGSMTLLDSPFGAVDFLYGDDFTLVTNAGDGEVTGEVVLVGHALSDANRKWNDYGDLDVKGKIVVSLRGTPDNGYDWGEAASRDSTLHEAVRRGAAAMLFRNTPRAVQGAAIHEGSYFPKMPSAVVGPRVIDHLLMNTGWDLDRYEKELKEKPVPLATGKRLRVRSKVSLVKSGHARDVVGWVRGNDPKLADELVVVGGHMDHCGLNGKGIVYNGANDNASGSSVVMELARSFAQSVAPTKRTVVFMTFAGEEQGLLGSAAFAKNPSFDLDHVVMMINFDMVGHGNAKVGLGGGEYYPQIRAAFKAALDSARADSLVIGRTWRSDASDHASFRREGVPVVNMWSEGDHRFYHTLQDDPKWISADVLGSVGRMAEEWIRTLADWPEPLLGEHRAGRSLLYAADQVDFSGELADASRPSWVRAGVRWFDPRDVGGNAYLDALAELRRRTDRKEVALVRSFKGVRDTTKDGRYGVVLSLREAAGLPASRKPLLADLQVGMVRAKAPIADPDSSLAAIAKAGAIFLVPPDSACLAALPKDAKRYVRLFPDRAETVAAPDSLPRKTTMFVVGVEGTPKPDELAAVIDRLGRDRVHLDLVPYLTAANEPAICDFLEKLGAAGDFSFDEMTALLGGNLGRF